MDLTFPYLADDPPRFNALDFDPATGILFASLNDGDERGGGHENQLATVDTTAGVVEIVGQTVDGLDTISFAPLDPFVCNKVKTTKGTPKFKTITRVNLIDQFEVKKFDLRKPVAHCNPTGENQEGINDSETHVEGYQIKLSRTDPKQSRFERLGNVEVASVFGPLFVNVLKQERLLVPTAKDLAGPIDAPDAARHEVDHDTCYGATVSKDGPKFAKNLRVLVSHQFKEAKLYEVGNPTKLCTLVDKSGAGIKNPDGHLICCRVRLASRSCGEASPHDPFGAYKREADCGGTAGETKFCSRQSKYTTVSRIHASNQFGLGLVDTVKDEDEELCVPSVKILPAPCGDGKCNHGENGVNCSADCGCAALSCGSEDPAPGVCYCDSDRVNVGDCCVDACSLCGSCGPAVEDLTTCYPPVTDSWGFSVRAGEVVFISVDTIDVVTAAYRCFRADCASGDFLSGDDLRPPTATTTTTTTTGLGACPDRLTFDGDGTSYDLDLGWTGVSHDSMVIADEMLTFALGNCAGSARLNRGKCDICGRHPFTDSFGNTSLDCPPRPDVKIGDQKDLHKGHIRELGTAMRGNRALTDC